MSHGISYICCILQASILWNEECSQEHFSLCQLGDQKSVLLFLLVFHMIYYTCLSYVSSQQMYVLVELESLFSFAYGLFFTIVHKISFF